MENKLKIITKWLADSGLNLNEVKTELCLFYWKDTPPVEITLNGNIIKSKDNMNMPLKLTNHQEPYMQSS